MTRFDLRELLVDEEEGEVTLWEYSFLPIEHRRNARILKTNWGRRDPASGPADPQPPRALRA
jgi:hypothetical protein